jgi:triacylglycerol lipase
MHRAGPASIMLAALGVLLGVALGGCHPGATTAPDDGGTRVTPGPPGIIVGHFDGGTHGGPLPIILVHGFAGFDHIGGVDYFYGVGDALRTLGRTVYEPALDAFNGSATRGAALDTVIATALEQTGADKVVLIAHSQGGLDARWAASHAPGSVAAVVTIATPHHGTKIADVALGLTPGPAASAADALVDLLGVPDTDLASALQSLSTSGAAAFNAAVPDVPGVRYYSIAGRSALRDAKSCPPTASEPSFISKWDSQLDALDPTLAASGLLLEAAELPQSPAVDGLVDAPSAVWGQFLGCIPADHLEEICQPLGAPAGLGNRFDCLDFYRGLEAFLADAGF